MKKTINILLITLLMLIFIPVSFAQDNIEKNNAVELHVFYGQGCPHCSSLLNFLESQEKTKSSLIINKHEVYQDNEERKLFEELSSAFEVPIQGVPTTFINDKVIIGFSNSIAKTLEKEIDYCLTNSCVNSLDHTRNNETTSVVGDSSPSKKKLLGNKLTIPIVILAAAVDAINPCAFAVLIILMTAALSIADKKRALKFGIFFTVAIYISYFLVGLGLFSIIQTASSFSHYFYLIITLLALIIGLLNLKDFFWYGKGFLMEIPLSWRPAMKKLINRATSPIGAFLVGFIVSLFELPCTGGPYLVILGLLANEVSRSVGIGYLLLYNLIFVAPLIILSIIIYKGLASTQKLESIRQDKLKILHLIAGIIMLGIASAMIFALYQGWV